MSNEGVGRYATEAVTGGVAGGIVSAIPIVNFANVCCCSLNMGGAVFGLWLWFRNHQNQSLSTGDVAIMGAISGAITGLITTVVDVVTRMVVGPSLAKLVEQYARDIPPELASMLVQSYSDPTAALMSAPFNIALFGGFGVIGAVVGSRLFFADRVET